MKLDINKILRYSLLAWLLSGYILDEAMRVEAHESVMIFQTTEDEVWKQVTAENTVDAYQRYMFEFPEGTYIDAAIDKIVVLRDENAWKEAVAQNTSSSYRKYLKIYPRGLHVEEAKAASRRLSGPTESSNTVASNSRGNDRPVRTERPASNPPREESVTQPEVVTERPAPKTESTPAKKAEPEPAVDPEEEMWRSAVQTGTELAYKNYLSTYPNGKYVEQAIPKVPMELDLQRSNAVDSVFVLTVKYAEQPVQVRKAEIPREFLSYTPAEIPESVSKDTLSDGTLVNQYQWPEGRFHADVTSIDPVNTEIILTLGREQKYEVLLADVRNNTRKVELEGALAPLELLGVLGYEPENDTLFLTIRGGKPDYYVRIVELGKEVNDFVHEEVLKPDRYDNTWYLAKQDLIRENKITSGNYDVYVVDSRKLESIKYTRSVAFGTGHLISNMEFRKFLIFPLGILVILLLVRWVRSSRNSSGSRYRKFKF